MSDITILNNPFINPNIRCEYCKEVFRSFRIAKGHKCLNLGDISGIQEIPKKKGRR